MEGKMKETEQKKKDHQDPPGEATEKTNPPRETPEKTREEVTENKNTDEESGDEKESDHESESSDEVDSPDDKGIKQSLQKLMLCTKSKALAAELKRLAEKFEPASEDHKSAEEDPIERPGSRTEKKKSPAQKIKRKKKSPAQKIKRRPSLTDKPTKMAGREPISGRHSKWPARNSPEEEKDTTTDSEDSDTDTSGAPSETEIERAIKALTKALSSELEASKHRRRRARSKSRRDQRRTHRGDPEDTPRSPATPRTPTTRPKEARTRKSRKEKNRYSPDDQNCSPDRSRITMTQPWIPNYASEASLERQGLFRGAAAERSSSTDAWSEMESAHAQSDLRRKKKKKVKPHHLKVDASVPMPYCAYRHIQHLGQPTSVSSFNYNNINLPTNFPRLRTDGSNILLWNKEIQRLLLLEGVLNMATNPPKKPWELDTDCLHHKAFNLLLASISPDIYPSISHNLTVSELMHKMFELFRSQNVSATTRIFKNLYSAKLKPGMPVSEHLLALNAIRAELKQRGEPITEKNMKSIVISSLDPSWDEFVMRLDILSLGHISLESLCSMLIAEDSSRRDRQSQLKEPKHLRKVIFQEEKHSNTECYLCGSRNHIKRNCPKNNRERENYEQRTRASERYPADYRRRSSPNPRDRRRHKDSSRDSQTGSLYGIGGRRPDTNKEKEENTWLLDSGATNHTTNDRGMLTSFTREHFKVKVANQHDVVVTGKGDVHIPGVGKVEGVLLVPEIPYNILATVKFSRDMGVEILFKAGEVHLSKDGRRIGKVITHDGLPHFIPPDMLPLSANVNAIQKRENINTQADSGGEEDTEIRENDSTEPDKETQETASNKGGESSDSPNLRISIGRPLHDNCAHMLHRRLGHASFPVLLKMTECAEGLKVKNCDNYLECSVCVCSKIKTKPRPKRATRTTESIFQLLHMDLVGPLRPSIKYKKRYFLTIVDDYSRYGFVYTLNHKNEAFQKFKELYKRVETQQNIKIKQIMTDRGTEFLSREFSNWLKAKGIIHFTSSPFSAFQNGTAERRNSTLQTMVRCALEDAGLNQSFWAEALTYSNYTLNRTWSSVINKTPYEAMYNRKPQIAHLHVFGVTADVHIPKQLRRKGDKVSRRLRFMGYETGTKGYRFIDSNHKFIISRTAAFHEQSNWHKIHLNDTQHIETTHHNKTDKPEIENRKGRASDRPGHTRQKTNSTEKNQEVREPRLDSLNQKEARYLHDTESATSRPKRENRGKIPKRLEDYVLTMQANAPTPNSYEEIRGLPQEEREKWEEAMDREMDSLKELKVFTPTTTPEGKSAIGSRWIFKIKTLENGKPLYKARLVAQGFAQKYPEDYVDTYSPTVRAESVKSALAIASILNMEVQQFDVQTAYLHAELDKEIYIRAPPSKNTKKGETWLLNKSLYGLKQSGKRWYECLVRVLKSIGFKATIADNCFFTKGKGETSEYVLVYVDDILYMGKDTNKCKKFAEELSKQFSLKSLGSIDKYLGVQVSKTQRGYKLSQKEKIVELLRKCNMSEAKPCDTPMQTDFLKNMYNEAEEFDDNTLYRSTIGSLLYIANWTRPDIALPINLLSRHVSKPTTYHWEAVKRVLRYLKHSMDACLHLEPNTNTKPIITCYADADWAGDVKSRKSTSGYMFFINGSPVHWYTGKQSLVATSTTEAEYICLSKATNNLIWFNDLISCIWSEPSLPITIHEDNNAAIEISKADAIGQRSRHIDIKHKHVRQLALDKFIEVVHCDTKEQIADLLTKPLPNKQHAYLMSKMCIHPSVSPKSAGILEGDLLRSNASSHYHPRGPCQEGVKHNSLPYHPPLGPPPYLSSTSQIFKRSRGHPDSIPDIAAREYRKQ